MKWILAGPPATVPAAPLQCGGTVLLELKHALSLQRIWSTSKIEGPDLIGLGISGLCLLSQESLPDLRLSLPKTVKSFQNVHKHLPSALNGTGIALMERSGGRGIRN